jgi:predicted nuclease with TOPRIM domain
MMAEWGVVVDAGGIVGTLADRPPAGEPSRTSAIDAQPGTGATREDALTGALASERTRAEALARALAEAEQQLAELHEAAAAGGAGEGKRQRGDASKSRAEAEAARAEEQAARAEADAARHEAAEALLHAERLGQEVGQWREQAERAESELHALRARLEQAEADAQQSRARLERAEAEAHGLRLRVEEATAGGERSERRLQEAQGDMQRLRERIEEGVADAERLRTRAEEAEAERERLHARLAEAQAADDRLRARLAEAEANADRLRARLEETEAHAERLRADLASAQTEAQGQARPHDVQPEVRAALAAAEAERDTAVRTNARLMEELKAGQRELAYVREVSAATAQRAQELVGALAAERRHTDDLLRAFREQSSASQHSRGSGGPDWLADTQRALLDALTQAATWPAGLASAVEVLGSGGAWDAVTAWSFSEPDDWHCEGVWTRDPDLQKFAGLTRKTPPSGDGSLHRQALQEPRLTWLSVLDAEHDARLVAVAEHGMRAALLLPIRAAGAPVGLIELVTRDSLDPDPQIVMGLEAAALHLGSFAERVTGAAG